MLTIHLVVAYIVFGLGFAAYICTDNPAGKEIGQPTLAIFATIMWLTWPIWFIYKLGEKAAKVLS